MLSTAEEAGRRWLVGCSEQERGWVSYRTTESWLCRLHEVEVLRVPLAFGRAHAGVTLSENGHGAVATSLVRGYDGYRSAASKVAMRSGRHFAKFTVLQAENMLFGVIRGAWSGSRIPDRSDWGGGQRAREQGDRIGMLLDLDQGSMTLYKNDEKLGITQAVGLSGPLCWAVSHYMYDAGSSARIESAPATPSPTEAELAAAREATHDLRRERREDLGLPLAATDAECEAAEAAEVAADDSESDGDE